MTYKIELEQNEIQIICAGLGKLPLEVAINVFGKIQDQAMKQDAAAAIPLSELGLEVVDPPSGAKAP